MKITSNIFSKIGNKIGVNSSPKEESKCSASFQQNLLPSVDVAGISQVEKNLPISYSKIGEISIPGLENKASVFKLENGQKVVIAPRKGVTNITTIFNVGKNDEKRGQREISHLIEHSLFNGSKNLEPSEYTKKMSEIGARVAACTGICKTSYSATLLPETKEDLEQAIKLNALKTQFPAFYPEQLEKEKIVVDKETKMYKDFPIRFLEWTHLQRMYDPNFDVNEFFQDKSDDVPFFNSSDLKEYYNTWCSPDNCCTVITGDVDIDETMQLVSKYFNKKNDFSSINKREYTQLLPRETSSRFDIVHPNANFASGILDFLIPIENPKEDYDKIAMIVDLLNSPTSDFQKEVTKYGQISIDSSLLQKEPNPISSITINLEDVEEKDIEKLLKIMYKEITKFVNTPVSQDELNKIIEAKIEKDGKFVENALTLSDKLGDMIFSKRLDYFDSSLINYKNETPQSIMDFSQKFLDLNKASLTVCHQKDSTLKSIKENHEMLESSTSSNVSFGAIKPYNQVLEDDLKEIKTYRLGNNIETTFIPSNYAQSINATFTVHSPVINAANKASCLALELFIQTALFRENLDSKVDCSLSEKGLKFTIDTKSEDISSFANEVRSALKNVEFPEKDLEEIKDNLKKSYSQGPADYISGLGEALFANVPQYVSNKELIKQLDSLSLDDVKALYSQIMDTACASLIVSGDVKKNIDSLNNDFSKDFPIFKPYFPEKVDEFNYYEPNTAPKSVIISNNEEMIKVAQGFKYKRTGNLEDTAKILLLKAILGGGSSSRLFSDLREKQKLAYTVGAGVHSDDTCLDIGTIVLNCETTDDINSSPTQKKENLEKVLQGFFKHTEALKNENISAEELKKAKKFVKSMLILAQDVNSDRNKYYSYARTSPYDLNSYKLLFEAIDNITIEDIKVTARYVFANPPITCISSNKKNLSELGLQPNYN